MRIVSALIVGLFVVAVIGCGQAKKEATPVVAKDSITTTLAAPVVDTTKTATVDTAKAVQKK